MGWKKRKWKKGVAYVRRSRHTQALGARLQREDLARHDPRQGTPRAGEEENVEANKRDAGFLGRDVVHDDVAIRILARRQGSEHGDDELAHAHADGAPQQQRTTAYLVDGVETGEGGDDVDAGRDHLDGEGVLDARVLEVLGSVVEDEVDTRQLLQRLDAHTRQLALEHRAPEAVEVVGLADAHLVVVVRLDLLQLGFDGCVLGIEAAELAERSRRLVVLALLD